MFRGFGVFKDFGGVLGLWVFRGLGCFGVFWVFGYLGVLGCLGITVKRLRV